MFLLVFYLMGCFFALVDGLIGLIRTDFKEQSTWMWVVSVIICIPIWILTISGSWVTIILTYLYRNNKRAKEQSTPIE